MPMKKTIENLDAYFHRRGFIHPDVRELARNQAILLFGVTLCCLPFAMFYAWAWSFAAGAILITLNFWSLARFGQRIVVYESRKEAVLVVLFRFYFRLGLTGAALYALIVWAGANVMALLAGLSILVVNFLFWGVSKMSLKTRELPN